MERLNLKINSGNKIPIKNILTLPTNSIKKHITCFNSFDWYVLFKLNIFHWLFKFIMSLQFLASRNCLLKLYYNFFFFLYRTICLFIIVYRETHYLHMFLLLSFLFHLLYLFNVQHPAHTSSLASQLFYNIFPSGMNTHFHSKTLKWYMIK